MKRGYDLFHKARAQALLDDPPRLDILSAEEVIAVEFFRRGDDSFGHGHAMPGVEAPPIGILDAAASVAVEATGVVEGEGWRLPHHQGNVFAEPVAGDHLVKVGQRMSLFERSRPANCASRYSVRASDGASSYARMLCQIA